jgi:hypothetical protein
MECISPFWQGLIIGLFIGTNFGVFICGLCVLAKDRRKCRNGAQEKGTEGTVVRIR